MEGGKREGIPGEYSGFRVTGMIEGFFCGGGVEIFRIVGFVWVGNFTGNFGWLDLVGIVIWRVFEENNMQWRLVLLPAIPAAYSYE